MNGSGCARHSAQVSRAQLIFDQFIYRSLFIDHFRNYGRPKPHSTALKKPIHIPKMLSSSRTRL
jgi:hypothetical protein